MRRQPQSQRAPPATEIENPLTIGQFRAFGIPLEHRDFGLCERLIAGRVQTARILQMRSEMRMEERRRHLVVLRVGSLGFDGNRTRAQVVQQTVEPLRTQLAVIDRFVAQTLAHQLTHAETDQAVGQPAAFAALDQPAITCLNGRRRRHRLAGGGKTHEADSLSFALDFFDHSYAPWPAHLNAVAATESTRW
jgi:hypothetical protein